MGNRVKRGVAISAGGEKETDIEAAGRIRHRRRGSLLRWTECIVVGIVEENGPGPAAGSGGVNRSGVLRLIANCVLDHELSFICVFAIGDGYEIGRATETNR